MARVSTTPGNTTVRVFDAGLVGPIGPQGPAGPQGPQGNQGITGPQGADGTASNVAGPQGAQGPLGPQGADGAASNVAGPQGAQGPLGPQGADGAASNVAGPQGAQGPTGSGSSLPAAYSGSLIVVSPSGSQFLIVVDESGNLSTTAYSTGSGSGSGSGIVQTNLMAELDASNVASYPGSGSIWTDLTGNGHNAELQGFTTSPYTASNGGIFEWPIDGTTNENIAFTSSVSINDFSLGNTAPLTIQMWVYTPQGAPSLLNKYGVPGVGYNVSLNTASTNNYFTLSYDGYGVNSIGNPGVTKNAWNFLTFIFKDTQPSGYVAVEAYVNDTSVWTSTLNPITSWSVENLVLQVGLQSPQEWYGKLGAMYFYNAELSSSDITTNFNATKTRFGL